MSPSSCPSVIRPSILKPKPLDSTCQAREHWSGVMQGTVVNRRGWTEDQAVQLQREQTGQGSDPFYSTGSVSQHQVPIREMVGSRLELYFMVNGMVRNK